MPETNEREELERELCQILDTIDHRRARAREATGDTLRGHQHAIAVAHIRIAGIVKRLRDLPTVRWPIVREGDPSTWPDPAAADMPWLQLALQEPSGPRRLSHIPSGVLFTDLEGEVILSIDIDDEDRTLRVFAGRDDTGDPIAVVTEHGEVE